MLPNSEPGDTVSLGIPDTNENPEEAYLKREEEQILSLVINELPPTLQTALLLYLDDLTVNEMARCLGVGRPAVKARLFRGRHKACELFKCYRELGRRRTCGSLENAA